MDSEPRDPDQHGGDLAAAERMFGRPSAGWLDLSTGINPNPYPNLEVSQAALARLPGTAEYDALIEAARVYYRVPNGAAITAASGTQALIQVLPQLVAGARVSIAGPTYGEHELVWSRAGRAIGHSGDITVVVNPNNPDGRITLPSDQGMTIVDEAFCDLMPEASAIGLFPRDNLIVLRSFGKFFGLGGLRLGFCISSPDFAVRLTQMLGPWAVSGPALEIGTRALSDQRWISETRAALAAARARLDRVLGAAGLRVIGGTDLFRLVDTPDAAAIYRRLGAAGILVRPFADHPKWLRFGLPGNDAEFARLTQALSSR